MTTLRSNLGALAVAFVLVLNAIAQAQVPAAPPRPAPEAPKPIIPLKVQVVLSRYEGEKKITSLPFTLMVNANDRSASSLNMSTQVPVANSTIPSTSAGVVTSFTYKNLGTHINCEATTLDDGRIRLNVTVDDSSMFPDKGTGPATSTSGIPSFQSITSANVIVFKDGRAFST